MSAPLPVATLCPYLGLGRAYEFADFWLGPLSSFEGSWIPPDLEDAVRTLLARFVTVTGAPVERTCLVANRRGIVDGSAPLFPEALELAIAFGALVRNPRHPIVNEDSWRVVTADNCDVWIQPIDLEGHRITLERGSRVRIIAGGYRFDDDSFLVPAPLELHTDGGGSFDAAVADGVYRVVSAPEECTDPPLARRLRQAVRWWIKAWRNSTSVSWEDRLVHLRTAVDALVGSDSTQTAIKWLNDLFASVAAEDRTELLWADDQGDFDRTWGLPPRTHSLPAFEHWFRSFADARNEIVHDGGARSLQYNQKDSPYAGPFVDVADRVVAEAILIALGRCGFPHLWRSELWRACAHALSADIEQNPTYTAHATPTSEGWIVAVVGDELAGIEVLVDDLEGAEIALAKRISERVGSEVLASDVYVIPGTFPPTS